MKRKHAELIKKWADGAEIQVRDANLDAWKYQPYPAFYDDYEYREKPKPDGAEYKLASCANRFELSKGDAWEEAMADQSKVIVDGKVITSAQANRKHLHDRLDMWMDNNWRFE